MNEQTGNVVISYETFEQIFDLFQAVDACQVTEEQITRCNRLGEALIAVLPEEILGMAAGFFALESLRESGL